MRLEHFGCRAHGRSTATASATRWMSRGGSCSIANDKHQTAASAREYPGEPLADAAGCSTDGRFITRAARRQPAEAWTLPDSPGPQVGVSTGGRLPLSNLNPLAVTRIPLTGELLSFRPSARNLRRSPMPLDLPAIRARFPALQRQTGGRPIAFFDGPAGSQVPQSVVNAVSDSLLRANANCGAVFTTSQENDRLLAESRQAVADLLGTGDPDTVAFGANMTSLTLAASRAIASIWKPGDEVIVSQLDHDANVTPWVLAAQDAGATVHSIPLRLEDCTLDLDRYRELLSPRTRLVAVGLASNATGTINPVAEMVRLAKAVGALTFVDAVHYAPHGLIDVEALGCDFLVCSAYKFFGPHVGIMWGKREWLEAIRPYKLRPSSDELPGRWMTGTQNHEGIAGVRAAVDHIASLGAVNPDPLPTGTRRAALGRGFEAITFHERAMSQRFLAGLRSTPSLRVWGITDEQRLVERVPTFSVTHESLTPREMATSLWARGIQAWHGNHYALPFTEAAGLEPNGTLRLGALHYNTLEEVDRAIDALRDILRTRAVSR